MGWLITIVMLYAVPLSIPAGVSAAHHTASGWRNFASWHKRMRVLAGATFATAASTLRAVAFPVRLAAATD
jgi:hypothetical protein